MASQSNTVDTNKLFIADLQQRVINGVDYHTTMLATIPLRRRTRQAETPIKTEVQERIVQDLKWSAQNPKSM